MKYKYTSGMVTLSVNSYIYRRYIHTTKWSIDLGAKITLVGLNRFKWGYDDIEQFNKNKNHISFDILYTLSNYARI